VPDAFAGWPARLGADPQTREAVAFSGGTYLEPKAISYKDPGLTNFNC
jgi:hypothetical protein